MRSGILERAQLAAELGLRLRDVKPITAADSAVQVALSGNALLAWPLVSFSVPKDRCALLTLFSFDSFPDSLGGGVTTYPETFADVTGRRDGIGWLNNCTVQVDTPNGNLIKRIDVGQLNNVPVYVFVPPGATVTVNFFSTATAESEITWRVNTRVEGYTLPDDKADDASTLGTNFL